MGLVLDMYEGVGIEACAPLVPEHPLGKEKVFQVLLSSPRYPQDATIFAS